MKSHVNDTDLSEVEYVKKYIQLLKPEFRNDEVKNYLQLRWKCMNKLASWSDVRKAYNKTNLKNANNNSKENCTENAPAEGTNEIDAGPDCR